MSDLEAKLSRRLFLRRTAAFGTIAGLGALLAACGGAVTAPTNTPPGAAASVAPSAAPPASSAPASASAAPAVSAGPAGTATRAATTTAGAAATPATSSSAPIAATAPFAPAASYSGKLLVWGVVSFTPAGDQQLGQQMVDWGKANKVEVEYVALPGSDYAQKLTAAVETGALPDVVMMLGDTVFYAGQNRLVDLTDVYNSIKGLGGGMWPSLLPSVQVGDKIYSIPMEADVTVLYARLDLCEKATGKRAAPATLDEMDMIMRKVNEPPKQFGFGMTLGRTPDAQGNIQTLIFADGGTLVDKDGNPSLNNEGTISALTRVQTWWKDKLIPPDSPAWDDTKNNASYQSRQSCFAINPASIFAFLEANDKELLGQTIQAPLPKGKAGSFPQAGCWSWSIFSASKNIDAGKAMIQNIMAPDKVQAVYEKVGGRWYPVYKDLANAKWWKDRPYFDQFPTILETARPAFFPATATPKLLSQLSAASNRFVYADMLQDVVVKGTSPQEAAKTAQARMEQAFSEVK